MLIFLCYLMFLLILNIEKHKYCVYYIIIRSIVRCCFISTFDMYLWGIQRENIWGIERSGFFNGREKWAKGFENQRV